jgi:hypothetical protein
VAVDWVPVGDGGLGGGWLVAIGGGRLVAIGGGRLVARAKVAGGRVPQPAGLMLSHGEGLAKLQI